MVLDIQGAKEVGSNVFEEKASNNVEEVFRLHAQIRRLKQEINNLEPTDEKAQKYKRIIAQIRSIIDRIIAKGLGDDETLSDDEPELQYEFLGNSKLRIGQEILDLPEDVRDESQHHDIGAEFTYLKLNEQPVCQISDGIYIPAGIFEKLYPHQKKGIKWLAGLYERKHGGILADEMGLGKTITVLSFLNALMFSMESKGLNQDERLEVLIVCPITLIAQWKDEMSKWTPSLKPVVFHGALGSFNKGKLFAGAKRGKHRALITSYDTLRIHIDSINVHPWSYVVLDEGQKIRNPDAAITLSVKTLGTPHRLLLSGSPIQNNLVEFWSLLDFVAPGQLGTLPLFVEQFVEPIMRSNNICNASAAYNCALRLRSLVHPFIQRNLKSDFADCLKLPKKTEHIIMCSLTPVQYQVYITLLKTVLSLSSLDDGTFNLLTRNSQKQIREKLHSNRVLVLLTMLRKVCNHPDLVLQEIPKDFGCVERSAKLMIALEIIANWEASGHKVLVFSQTIQMLNIIYGNLVKVYKGSRIARLDGEVAIKKRSSILNSFEKDNDVFILLLTTRVGGVGLNLTCADRILIFDPDWNPMTDSQARERSYRIGQNHDVVIYRLISAHTVEEKIYHRQIYKFYLSERILTDPRVVGFRFLPTSALLTIPPKPSGPKDTTGYCNKVEKQLKSLDFEMEIRRINNSKDIYQRCDDVPKNTTGENPILQSIFAHHDIEGVIKHDDIEKTVFANVEPTSSVIADKAVELLKMSLKEREAYDISVPTWTGENGLAAAPVNHKRRHVNKTTKGNAGGILRNLSKNSRRYKMDGTIKTETFDMAKTILDYFRRCPNFNAPTGEVNHEPLRYEYFAVDAFKTMLNKICTLKKTPQGPNYWMLKQDFIDKKTIKES
ncbi:SNF2 domain-containing protein / helicase domain- containing protein [Babesia divergens]|uniref:SNF2 domain-containing protein / helicase domain-containing protein n=1 Tax=Babesia divergens TaxID=32595 RepID=A0AAD9GJI0_BABDI|nr:SNF2 domain-containing protein / helicase domain- containing protein [Babesia divergens]